MKKSRDYTVGYQNPPKHSQFKIGNTEHLKRKKKEEEPFGSVLVRFLSERVTYREKGKKMSARRIDLKIKTLGTDALKGDVSAADLLLQMREGTVLLGELAPIVYVFDEVEEFL